MRTFFTALLAIAVQATHIKQNGDHQRPPTQGEHDCDLRHLEETKWHMEDAIWGHVEDLDGQEEADPRDAIELLRSDEAVQGMLEEHGVTDDHLEEMYHKSMEKMDRQEHNWKQAMCVGETMNKLFDHAYEVHADDEEAMVAIAEKQWEVSAHIWEWAESDDWVNPEDALAAARTDEDIGPFLEQEGITDDDLRAEFGHCEAKEEKRGELWESADALGQFVDWMIDGAQDEGLHDHDELENKRQELHYALWDHALEEAAYEGGEVGDVTFEEAIGYLRTDELIGGLLEEHGVGDEDIMAAMEDMSHKAHVKRENYRKAAGVIGVLQMLHEEAKALCGAF